jgi:hypothetical protein
MSDIPQAPLGVGPASSLLKILLGVILERSEDVVIHRNFRARNG